MEIMKRSSDDLGPCNARYEARSLLALATDELSTKKLRLDIAVSAVQEAELKKVLGPVTANSIVRFREEVLREFDRLITTQLKTIQLRAKKARARIARRKPVIAAQMQVYQKQWEAKRRRAREEATA
jgi:hypothetical protein